MGKCEFCGKAVVLPFQCSFCRKYFCGEHKLPENHQCSDMLSVHVHAKQRISQMHTTERLERKCPKCGSTFTEVQAVGKETVTMQCTTCSFKWEQPR